MRFLKKIATTIDRPIFFITIFALVMIVPNMVLDYTEPYSVTTILANLMLPAGFYILWVIASRKTGVMVLASLPFMILGAFQLVITYLFGNSIIAVDMFTNLFTTNASEAGELLGSIYPSVIIVCVLYIPLIILAIRYIRKKQQADKATRKKFAIAALALLVMGSGLAIASDMRNDNFKTTHHIFPVNVGYNIKLSIERWNKSLNFLETSADFTFNATKEFDQERREIYVFVIGEAARACSWSLYGYDRATNPLLSQREDITVFKDVLTESNTTHKSVPIMLSQVSAHNFEDLYSRKSVLTMFKEAGFKTAFISNQPANRSLIDYFAEEADTLIDVTSHSSILITDNRMDGEILPHLENVIDESNENLFIVIHTYGSHATHYKRYPREFAQFTPDEASSVSKSTKAKVVNAYDNSILYTDYILNSIIEILDNGNTCSAMLYCSDHGEDLMDDDRERFLHASPTTTYYQLHVAAFAWFSENYTEVFPEKRTNAEANINAAATTGSLFHSIADMASIGSVYADKSRSLFSGDWKEIERLYVNDYDLPVNVLQSGLDDLDIEQFRKHGLKFDLSDYIKEKY